MARPDVRWPLLVALLAGICPVTVPLPGASFSTASSAISGNASSSTLGPSAARLVAESRLDEEEGIDDHDDGSDAPRSESDEDGDEEWWAGASEEDGLLALALHGGEGGLWAGAFVPPPPRPDFLDERVVSDGLTTCDLCTWAWHARSGSGGSFLDTSAEHPGKISWALTLAIVSILSAAIGAVIMVTVLQCRNRLKTVGSSGLCSLCTRSPSPAATPAGNAQERIQHHETANNKDVTAAFDNRDGGGRVWTWLTNRRTSPGPTQLSSPAPTAPAENHYTLDEAYTAVGEALYAELDRESSSSPAYQNTAYNGSDTDPDAPPSSAPSSAYYSDLSCATAPDRTYEAVGVAMSSNPSTSWDSEVALRRHPIPRLAAITETITVPSDYV